MLRVYTGLPGEGKTTCMVSHLREAMRKKVRVEANFEMDLPEAEAEYFGTWQRLSETYNKKNCIIAIDELPAYADSRNWKNLPLPFLRKLQQHRKDALHIWGTCQSPKRLDVAFRELVDEWVVMRKITGSHYERPSADSFEDRKKRKAWGLFVAKTFDAERVDPAVANVPRVTKLGALLNLPLGGAEHVWLGKSLADSFDTMRHVDPEMPGTVHVQHLDVLCPVCGELHARHVDDPEV